MAITLNGTTGITTPASTVGGSAVLTTASSLAAANLTGSVPSSAMPAGSVLQVVANTGTTALSTTSTTLVSTGFSASITPKFASSKVYVIFSGRAYNPTGGNEYSLFIFRGGSNIQGGFSVYAIASSIAAQQTIVTLDSPATTSAVTYTLYHAISATGIGYINPNSATDGKYSFTLMEIAG